MNKHDRRRHERDAKFHGGPALPTASVSGWEYEVAIRNGNNSLVGAEMTTFPRTSFNDAFIRLMEKFGPDATVYWDVLSKIYRVLDRDYRGIAQFWNTRATLRPFKKARGRRFTKGA